MAYPDLMPVGTRIRVKAGPGEGTDILHNGHEGVIERWHGCSSAAVLFDKPKRGWPNPTHITAHNLCVKQGDRWIKP